MCMHDDSSPATHVLDAHCSLVLYDYSNNTGLGLHLVALQAEAMDASVEALAREGGGTLFRVSFRLAEEPSA